MQIFTKFLLTLSVLFSVFIITTPQTAYAACDKIVGPDGKWYAEGTTDFSKATYFDKDSLPADCLGEQALMGKILRFITMLSGLVIVAAVGMIIYAGLKYITGAGDPKQIESAKQQLWYSGVGLFIVLTAFTILKLFKNASGFD